MKSMAEQETSGPFFVSGGTMSSDAGSYVERSADAVLLTNLLAGKFCYVLNSRQMGKSSLCVRTMGRLHEADVATAFVDLTKLGGKNVTVEQWYAGIGMEIGRSLALRKEFLTYWSEHERVSPMQRLFGVLRDVALEKLHKPLAVFLDEIDATRSLPFPADEFFAGIRECYNRRVQDPALSRLTFCLLGVAVPSDLINSPASTPFNVGERIYLRDFSLEEAMTLASGLPGDGKKTLTRVYHWTNGHPYLTQTLCQAAATQGITTPDGVDDLVHRDLLDPKARETNINLADVANRALHAGDLEGDPEKFRADLLSAYEKAWKGLPLADDESNRVTALLKLSGMMRNEGNRLLVRNRIYHTVFDRAWIRENMPGQELRRQQRAYWLGVIRTTLIGAAIIGLVSWLAGANAMLARRNGQLAQDAQHAALDAVKERDHAQQEAYLADVNLMRGAYDDNDLMMVQRLLRQTKDSSFKSFEWYYWNRLLNGAPVAGDPNGLDWSYLSPDGTSLAIEDFAGRSADVFSVPSLTLLKHIDHLPTNEQLIYFGGRWTLSDWSSGAAIPVYDLDHKPLGRFDLGGKFGSGNEWSVNGDYFAWSCGDARGTHPDIAVFDAHSLKLVDTVRTSDDILGAMVSDDGQVVAWILSSSAGIGFTIRVFDRRSMRVVDTLAAGEPTAGSGIYSPIGLDGAGRFMSVGFLSGRAIVRDTLAHRNVFDKMIASSNVLSTTLSGDGKRLLTVSADLMARVWDLATGGLVLAEKGALSANLSLDGSLLAVGGAGTRIYPVRKRSIPAPRFAGAYGLETRPDGLVAVLGYGPTRLMDPDTLAAVSPHLSNRAVSPMRSSSYDGLWAVRLDGNGYDVVDMLTGHELCHLDRKYFSNFDVSSKQSIVMEDADVQTVHVYGPDGREKWKSKIPFWSDRVRWSPDGSLLAVGGLGGQVLLLEGDTGRAVRQYGVNTGSIAALGFSHDGKTLAVGDDTFAIWLYPTQDEGSPVELAGHSGSIRSLDFSPDDKRLLSASWDGTARLWDVSSLRETLRLSVPKLLSAAFDTKGQAIFTLDGDGRITAYRAPRI